jgi:arylsulfatase A-like enzyme
MYRNSPIPEPVFGDWSSDDQCPEAFKFLRQKQSFDLVPPEIIREGRAAYYGLITQIDYNLGRVFAALQDISLFNDTLIIYTSDHGEYLGDHHAGAKGFFHESSAHVPFVLRMPQGWTNRQHGSRSTALITLADILPTVVTAAGGSPLENVDGQDLIALARGDLSEPRRYLEATSGPPELANYYGITDGRWKYMWYPEGASEQLFDLETDPMELKNLAGLPKAATEQARLKAAMIKRHQARRSVGVKDEELVSRPISSESIADRRNQSWPGYHTEYYVIDVRH